MSDTDKLVAAILASLANGREPEELVAIYNKIVEQMEKTPAY